VIRATPLSRHTTLLSALLASLTLSGCSALSWFSSTPAKPPLPAVSGGASVVTGWTVSLGGKMDVPLQATAVGGKVFAAHADGSMFAIDEKNGAIINRFALPAGSGRISGGVAANASMIVVSSNKAEVFAFDTSGKSLWKSRIPAESIAPAAISDDVVIVSSVDGNIVGLDAKDGSRKWIIQRQNPALTVRTSAVPVVTRGGVFLGTSTGRLLAFDSVTGAIGWEATVANPKGASELERLIDVVGRPALDAQRACAAAFQGRVACFDILRGTPLWSRDVSTLTGAILDNRHVYVTDEKGTVFAYDRSTGGTVWKQDVLAQRLSTGAALIGDFYGVQDIEGNLSLVDRSTGKIAGRGLGSGFIAASPLTQGTESSGGAMLVTKSGQLVYLRAQ
jgi:outer membrane protein assembly factor BamB